MDQKRKLDTDRPTEPQLSPQEVVSRAAAEPIVKKDGIRILCVDDDLIGLRLRGEILSRHGYAVVIENCPLQALQRDLLAFDLAIVDYEMPGLNGVELFFAMRALHVAYPIILLSGGIDNVDISQQRLFYRCLEKAQPMEKLLAVIKSYVDSNGVPDQWDNGTAGHRRWMLR